MFFTFETRDTDTLNNAIMQFCDDNSLVEISRTAPTVSDANGMRTILVTSEFRELNDEEKEEKKKREMAFEEESKARKCTSIEKLGLSKKTSNALVKAGLLYVEDLLGMTRLEYLEVRRIGERGADEIVESLTSYLKSIKG